jgi:hypothetical protein
MQAALGTRGSSDTRRVAPTVLVVESDAAERDLLSSWFEDTGREVLSCPGPTAPDFTCIGSRTRACPLVLEAETIILDMSTESEALMTGVPSEALLAFYLLSGRRVVALGSHPASGISGQLVRLRRHPERSELLDAVASLEADTPAA